MLDLDFNQKKVLMIFTVVLILLAAGYIFRSIFVDDVRSVVAPKEQGMVLESRSQEETQNGNSTDRFASDEDMPYQHDSSRDKRLIKKIKVYIVGAVKYPGVIEVEEGSRLIDVINLAGGTTEEADLEKVNLALKVQDEGMYRIPKTGEELTEPNAVISSNAGSTTGQGRQKVNINTADEATLDTLPGIGPSKAKRIIEYREQNGPFKSIEEVKNVSGIGEKTFEQLKDLITVN